MKLDLHHLRRLTPNSSKLVEQLRLNPSLMSVQPSVSFTDLNLLLSNLRMTERLTFPVHPVYQIFARGRDCLERVLLTT